MIKSYIDTTTHMIETDLLRQFDIEKKYLLIGRHSQHVSWVDGNLTPSLFTERPTGELVRRGWYLAVDLSRQDFRDLLWKSNLHPQSPFSDKVNVRLGNDHAGGNRRTVEHVTQQLSAPDEATREVLGHGRKKCTFGGTVDF
jgi:hypothetical protein